MKRWRQYRLMSGETETMCWLDDDPRLQPGVQVTLKSHSDPTKLWTIEWRSDIVMTSWPSWRDWKVGGL